MDFTNHLSGCGAVEHDLFPLLGNQNVDLDNFLALFSPPLTAYNAPSSFVPSKNVLDMAGGDFSSIEVWLADGDEDTRAGEGPSRQGSVGLVASSAGDSRANQHEAGLVEGHAGKVARAGSASQEAAGEPSNAGGAFSGESGAGKDGPTMGGVA